MAVREDGTVAAFTPSRGVTLHVSSSPASCTGGDCLNNWTTIGPPVENPPLATANLLEDNDGLRRPP